MYKALLLLLLILLCASAQAETTLPECTTAADVRSFVDLTLDDSDYPVARDAIPGRIRHISQTNKAREFLQDYWMGGIPGSMLDLTQRYTPTGRPYGYYCGNMCTRSVYSMMLSYFGLDYTPGEMSRLTGERNIDNPYDSFTEAYIPELIRCEEMTWREREAMFARYQADTTYSPLALILMKDNGTMHSLLIVARDAQGRYLAIDPSPHSVNGIPDPVVIIQFAREANFVLWCSDARLIRLPVRAIYQWRLVEEETDP